MSIDAISFAQPTSAAQSTASAPKQDMDKEFFLRILVAQMQNQDPTSPMDTTDMMNQSVQLSMMEQMVQQTTAAQENFALNMRLAAMQMVDKDISYIDADGNTVSGTVTGVNFDNAVPALEVDGVKVPLDRVASVNPTSNTPNDPDPEGSDDTTTSEVETEGN